MLAFYIFLNSLVLPNPAKQREVLASVRKEFPRGADRARLSPPRQAEKKTLAELFPAAASLAANDTSLTAQGLTGNSSLFHVNISSESLDISAGAERLFLSNDDQIRAELLPLLAEIAGGLKKSNTELEIRAITRQSVADAEDLWHLPVSRAMSLVRLFLDLNVPTQQLSAAVHPATFSDIDSFILKITWVKPV